MQPAIDILGLEVKTFGLMFALGWVATGIYLSRRLRELGKPDDWTYELVFAGLLGGFIGARVYWLVEHAGELDDGLLSNVFSGTGLVWYGGAIGGTISVLAWARWRGMFGVALLDLCAVPLALGQAIGRIGCQLSGDGDYGRPWDGPWAMAYPKGTVPTDVPVHPTPLYETLALGLTAWVLWRLRDSLRPGLAFALYLIFAGSQRFLVEFVRRNDDVALGLTAAQLQSLALVVAGATWLALAARRGGLRRAPAAPAARRAVQPA